MPLVRPFRTSFGTETDRDVILIRVRTADADGWGECVAGSGPDYSSEWIGGAWLAIERFLVPRLLSVAWVEDPADVGGRLAGVRGHR